MNLFRQTKWNDEDTGEDLKCMYNGAEDWEVNNMRDIYKKTSANQNVGKHLSKNI